MMRGAGFPPTHSHGTAWVPIVPCGCPQWVFLSKNSRALVFVPEAGNTSKAKQHRRKEHVTVQC